MKRWMFLMILFGFYAQAITIDKIIMVKEAVLAGHTYNVEGITDNFPIDQKVIYAVAKYSHASLQDHLIVKWISEDAINVPNYEIAKKDYTLDQVSGAMRAALSRPSSNIWPRGHYRVEVYKNTQKIAQKHFSIGMKQADASPNIQNPQQSVQSNHITQLFLAAEVGVDKDGYIQPKGISETFKASQWKLHVVVVYKELKLPGKMEFQWVVDEAGETRNQPMLRDTVAIERSSGAVYDTIEMESKQWPPGKFHVDIFCNGQKLGSAPFVIVQDSGTQIVSPQPGGQGSAVIQNLVSSKWVDRSTAKPLILFFPSLTKFSYGGNAFDCVIGEKVIKINGNKGWLTLPYTIKGNSLYLELNGNTGVFKRMQGAAQTTAPGSILRGKYCSSPKESNEWITFDGKGNFSFGSLSNAIVAAKGTYSVEGEWIVIRIKGEDLGKIHISQKDSAGIAAFSFDDITYTKALCPR